MKLYSAIRLFKTLHLLCLYFKRCYVLVNACLLTYAFIYVCIFPFVINSPKYKCENIYNFILSLLIFLWFNYFSFFCRQYTFFLFLWYIMTIIPTVHRPAHFLAFCVTAYAFNVELDLIPKRSNIFLIEKDKKLTFATCLRLQNILSVAYAITNTCIQMY